MYRGQHYSFNKAYLGKGFHTHTRKALFLSPTNVGSCWPVTYRCQHYGFNKAYVGRGFQTLIRNTLFPSPTDVGSHNLLPLGAQRPHWHTGHR